MRDILTKFAEAVKLGRLENVCDVQDFLVGGEDDLFLVASEKITGTSE